MGNVLMFLFIIIFTERLYHFGYAIFKKKGILRETIIMSILVLIGIYFIEFEKLKPLLKYIGVICHLLFFVIIISINLIKMLNLYFKSESLSKMNVLATEENTKSELTLYYIIMILVCMWILAFILKHLDLPILLD